MPENKLMKEFVATVTPNMDEQKVKFLDKN